ncbi:unnamed protein product, partial [Prorocentrum cordatum]
RGAARRLCAELHGHPQREHQRRAGCLVGVHCRAHFHPGDVCHFPVAAVPAPEPPRGRREPAGHVRPHAWATRVAGQARRQPQRCGERHLERAALGRQILHIPGHVERPVQLREDLDDQHLPHPRRCLDAAGPAAVPAADRTRGHPARLHRAERPPAPQAGALLRHRRGARARGRASLPGARVRAQHRGPWHLRGDAQRARATGGPLHRGAVARCRESFTEHLAPVGPAVRHDPEGRERGVSGGLRAHGAGGGPRHAGQLHPAGHRGRLREPQHPGEELERQHRGDGHAGLPGGVPGAQAIPSPRSRTTVYGARWTRLVYQVEWQAVVAVDQHQPVQGEMDM